jgi:hypothetical protein
MAKQTINSTSVQADRIKPKTSSIKSIEDSTAGRALVSTGAVRILKDYLLEARGLKIPSIVKAGFANIVFSPAVEPFMPTPMRMTESVSALWALIGLFSSAICQQRYGSSKPAKIEVDVHSATLMLMSLALFRIEGVSHEEMAKRVEYLDKGRISETYRAMATNM